MPTETSTADAPAIDQQLASLYEQMQGLQAKLNDLSRQASGETVTDYDDLLDNDGAAVSLSSLFGDSKRLIAIHNMGFICPYCTMWADGINGLLEHIVRENDAAVVVVSPDAPDAQREGKQARGWRMTMVSAKDSTFTKDMGYEVAEGVLPGASTFIKNGDGSITRYSKAMFGPGDKFCSVWSFADLLPKKPAAADA